MSFSIYMHTLFFSKKQISKNEVSLQISSVTVHEHISKYKSEYRGKVFKPCMERAPVLAFRREGVLTAEAAVCLTLFMFAALSLMALFQTTEAFFNKQQSLTQTARKMSICSPLTDEISIDAVKTFRPSFLVLYDAVIPLRYKIYIKSWTGYTPENTAVDGTEEKRVYYVTDFESVYHTTKDCTHLKISISMVDKSGLHTSVNEDGRHYTPCEKCGKYTNISENYYVTGEGNKYHNSLSCPGLKRTVHEVTDIHGLSACSRCG